MNAEIINKNLLEQKYKLVILMNCYNHENYIAQAVNSVIAQHGLDNTLILIYDDFSTDNTSSIAKQYAHSYPDKIAAILFSENNYSQGIKPLYSIIFPIIHTEYLAFCECDDYWIGNDRLIKQMEYLDSHLECTCVTGNCYCINESNDKFIYPPFTPQREHRFDIDNYRYGNRMPGQTASKLFRKSVYDSLTSECLDELNNLKANGDVILDTLCVLQGYIYHLSDFVSVYRKITSCGSSWSARTKNTNMALKRVESLLEVDSFARRWFCVDLLVKPHITTQLIHSVKYFLCSKQSDDFHIIINIIKLIKRYDYSFIGLFFESIKFAFHRLFQRYGIVNPPLNYDLSLEEIEASIKKIKS